MIACLCRNITDEQIKQAVCKGARCNKDLNRAAGKPQCGQCCKYTKSLIKETLGLANAKPACAA